MLTIQIGGFFSDAHKSIRNKIAERISLGKKTYLIVPEQQTVSSEREFIDFLPASSSLCFEVTNFTRFANTVFRSLGGLSGKMLDSGKRLLIMWKTLSELAPFLEMTKHTDINAGLVTQSLVALKEANSLGISPKDLYGAAEGLSSEGADARLKGKLTDLARIITTYKSILSENFQDSDDILSLLVGRLQKVGEELLSDWLDSDAHMFKSVDQWKEIIGSHERIQSVSAWEMDCFGLAWSEWFATDHPYANADRKFYDSIIKPYTCFIGLHIKLAR